MDEKPVWWCPNLRAVLANEEVVDLLKERNDSYVVAFRWLSIPVFFAGGALLAYAISSDLRSDGDGFNYLVSFTWTQVQGLFWLFLSYTFMLPSMALIYLQLKRERKAAK